MGALGVGRFMRFLRVRSLKLLMFFRPSAETPLRGVKGGIIGIYIVYIYTIIILFILPTLIGNRHTRLRSTAYARNTRFTPHVCNKRAKVRQAKKSA